ncbi:hypothetical protein KBY99_13665 [Cyanobium sp. Maggiore-St4-Cus]|nr:hypothetical protein [Cyanobium sp. Maggiore-St4-Cus]
MKALLAGKSNGTERESPKERHKREDKLNYRFPSNYKASEASIPLEGRRKTRKKKKTNYIILN